MRRSISAALFAVLVAAFISVAGAPATAATPPAPTTSEPAPVPGEEITYTGNIGTPGPRTVVVQKEYKGSWYSYNEAQTNATGDYSIKVGTTATDPRTFRIHAPAENGQEAVNSETFVLQTAQPDAPTTTDPDPAPGGTVTYKGNIGTDGPRTVTVQKEYKGKWYAQESRQTDADGDYTVPVTNAATAPRTYRILAPASGQYGALTSKTFVVKVAVPEAPERVGSKPYPGQAITYKGNIGGGPRTVILQKEYRGRWYDMDTTQSAANGDYEVVEGNVAPEDRTYRVFAPAMSGQASVTTEVFEIEPKKDELLLNIYRIGGDIRASGVNDPAIADRTFALQRKSGSSWQQVGDPATSDAEGNIDVDTPVAAGTYRMVGDPPAAGAAKVVSNEVTFRAGPSTIGKKAIYVTTDVGASPQIKGVDYKGSAVFVDGDTVSPVLDVDTIAVRGNSSARKIKKPYKLKFEDNYTPFGMGKEKTFILLANYGDRSLIRSKVAFDVGRQLDGLNFTSDSRFTELWVNGWYKGSYQLTESIKIDKNRMDINEETGQIIEFDPHYVSDGVPGMKGQSGMHYSWKDPDEFKYEKNGDPDPEGLTNAKIDAMKKKIVKFESVLYARDWSKVSDFDALPDEDDWTTYLDMKSAVDYYLAREFTKDNDADFYRSNFFYTDDVFDAAEKFFMGPIWDFDRSAGANTSSSTDVASPKGWRMRGDGSPNHYTNKIHWYTRISKDPRFLNALHDRWSEVKDVFLDASVPRLGNTNSGVYRAVMDLGGGELSDGYQVAANDRALWGKYGDRYAPRASTYPGEISWVRQWYEDRYTWMDGELTKTPPPIP